MTATSFPREALKISHQILSVGVVNGANGETMADALAASVAAVLSAGKVYTPAEQDAMLARFSARVKDHILDGATEGRAQ